MADTNVPYMTIDNIPVPIEGEQNMLELMRKAGINLPTFCYHSYLSVHGACRMCMVENERGGIEAACSTPPRAGAKIRTNTERLRRYRKNILELLLANHCRDCTTCDNSRSCALQDFAMRFDISDVRFPNTAVSTAGEDTSSYSISRDQGKCILCGDCVRMCHEVQNVGAIDFVERGSKMHIGTSFHKPIAETPCVGCGQCAAVCPTGAIVIKNDKPAVWKAIDDPNVRTTVQIAPAVRVGLGRELGFKDGDNVMGLMVTALRRIGFDEVYDTTIGADLTVIEESREFIDRIENGGRLPLFTSCCPAWVQYVEKKHPDLMPHVSTCRSPMQMLASLLVDDQKADGRETFNVAIMPCTAKKFEAAREEFKIGGRRNVDAVVSTKGLARMIKESGMDFRGLEPEAVDMPYGTISGAGVIFGVTGGVTEAVLRNVASVKSRGELLSIATYGQRGMQGIKEFILPYGDRELKCAVVSGLANAERIIQRMRGGEHFDFVEVMACPGGCISGGGQPQASSAHRADRGKGLYESDRLLSIRRSEDNPAMKVVYDKLHGREHELLHVHYPGHNG